MSLSGINVQRAVAAVFGGTALAALLFGQTPRYSQSTMEDAKPGEGAPMTRTLFQHTLDMFKGKSAEEVAAEQDPEEVTAGGKRIKRY